ncbi:hypothetical protein NPIL_249851 [Nephila pilipes]|uniref:Uncharacterized protein n=1 Tax=Nephila pilipes TaxID=299642 RepID=A0A8X6TCL9_NEPPI|nr:hypothetical protein NPIL_249851 [Nephila pilipes]
MQHQSPRPSSPSLTQDKETCETLRLMNERLRILKMQHEDAYSHVCHIESRYMDRESDFYKGAYGLYLTAKEAAEEAEAMRPRQDWKLQSSDSKSDALSIRPRGHLHKLLYTLKLSEKKYSSLN